GQRHRLVALPATAGRAEIRYAGGRREAGAGQHDDLPRTAPGGRELRERHRNSVLAGAHRAQPRDRRATATAFGWGLGEALDERALRKHAPDLLALNPDAA